MEEQEQQTPTLPTEGWWATKGPRFDRATGWLAAGLGLVLLVNMISSIVLWVKIRNLPPPSVHASCSGSYSSNMLMWVQRVDSKLIGVGAGAGEAEVAINFDLTQKTPGSEICVLHRSEASDQWQQFASTKRNSEQWQQTTSTLIGGMTYEAKLNLDYSQNWTYCIAERVSGEIIRVGPSQFIDLAWQSQHKYIHVQRLEPEQSSELKLRFWQLSTSSEPYTGPIRIDFFAEGDWENRLAPTFTAIASELVDLGDGRGVAYEISVERDSSWKHVMFSITLANGTTRGTVFRMEELETKQIYFITDF